MNKHLLMTCLLTMIMGFSTLATHASRNSNVQKTNDNTQVTESTTSKKFTVFQFNVWNQGVNVTDGYDGVVNTLAEIDADFMTISEVRNYDDIFYLRDLCVKLQKLTGEKYYTFYSYDSGLITKHPILESATIHPINGDHGTVYKAVTSIAGQRVALYTAHLDYQHYGNFMPRGYSGVTFGKLDGPNIDEKAIIDVCLESQRDESIKEFIADAKKETEKGSMVFIGGDFNEPSHLDWTEETKNLFEHNGAIVQWPVSTLLEQAGFKDAYRELYPNPVTHPCITFPCFNPRKSASSVTWTPDSDERDRIDFIHHFPFAGLSVTSAKLVGPVPTVAFAKKVENTGEDEHITPNAVWPSDHKGLLIEYTLDNVDPNTPDLKPEQEVETSLPGDKVCYLIKNKATKLYAARSEDNKVRLISKFEASVDPQAYWWFEDGDKIDDNFLVHNLATDDDCFLNDLYNDYTDNTQTEWNFYNIGSSCMISCLDKDDSNWTADDGNYVKYRRDANNKNKFLWTFEKVEKSDLPVAELQASTATEKHFYTLLNLQDHAYHAKAPATKEGPASMIKINEQDLTFFWYFEKAEKPNSYYIKNAAYPDLYLNDNDLLRFGKEKVSWTFNYSQATGRSNAKYQKHKAIYSITKTDDKSMFLSYSGGSQSGQTLTTWKGNITYYCDAWLFDEAVIPVELDSIEGNEFANAPKKAATAFSCPFPTALPEGVEAYYVKDAKADKATLVKYDNKVLPGNTGFVLFGDEITKPIRMFFSDGILYDIEKNYLKPTNNKAVQGKFGDYVLEAQNGSTQFYPAENKEIPAYKAYLGATGFTSANIPLFCSDEVIINAKKLDDANNTYTEERDKFYNKVVYSRNFEKSQWEALYIPFALNYADCSDDFEVARIDNIHQYDDNRDGKVDRTELEAFLLEADAQIEPNVPYLIKAKNTGMKEITANDVILKKAEETQFYCLSWTTRYLFNGTYKGVNGKTMFDNKYFTLLDGELKQATSADMNLQGFRWYLSVEDRNTGKILPVNKISLLILDEFGDPTGIEDIELSGDNEPQSTFNVYDLQGKLVKGNAKNLQGLRKGIYIVNGKKVIL